MSTPDQPVTGNPNTAELLDSEASGFTSGAEEDQALTVGELTGGLKALVERLDEMDEVSGETAEGLKELGDRVEVLSRVVADLVKKDQTPIEPLPWAARATAQDWQELCDWVDWLTGAYEFVSATVPACWPAHAGVVEELAGVWRAWIEATVADTRAKQASTSALTAWHDRWLWHTINRITRDHYTIKFCTSKHEPQRYTRQATDRSKLPTSQFAAAQGNAS